MQISFFFGLSPSPVYPQTFFGLFCVESYLFWSGSWSQCRASPPFRRPILSRRVGCVTLAAARLSLLSLFLALFLSLPFLFLICRLFTSLAAFLPISPPPFLSLLFLHRIPNCLLSLKPVYTILPHSFAWTGRFPLFDWSCFFLLFWGSSCSTTSRTVFCWIN
jgi:hypothetical protein